MNQLHKLARWSWLNYISVFIFLKKLFCFVQKLFFHENKVFDIILIPNEVNFWSENKVLILKAILKKAFKFCEDVITVVLNHLIYLFVILIILIKKLKYIQSLIERFLIPINICENNVFYYFDPMPVSLVKNYFILFFIYFFFTFCNLFYIMVSDSSLIF